VPGLFAGVQILPLLVERDLDFQAREHFGDGQIRTHSATIADYLSRNDSLGDMDALLSPKKILRRQQEGFGWWKEFVVA
jgi:hypothetical protein